MRRKNSIRFIISPALIACIFSLDCLAQDSSRSKPPVTSDFNIYQRQVKADPAKKMIELRTAIPGIVYDLRYSQTRNFVHRRMYPEGTHETFLRLPAASALAKAQKELAEKGLGLKIFDAYRPYSVTVQFWELVKDTRYVASPQKGSGHNRGIAVDLTLIDLKTGKELDMGTDFDNFSDSAHHTFKNLPAKVLQNRLLLKKVMEKSGFKALNTEWWHYFLPGSNKYEILDISFEKLKEDG